MPRSNSLYQFGASNLSASKKPAGALPQSGNLRLSAYSSLTWPGAFGLPATFQTPRDGSRGVSELHPIRLTHSVLPLSEPSRQTGVFRCAKSLCRGAK
jgi:hypothetical protein